MTSAENATRLTSVRARARRETRPRLNATRATFSEPTASTDQTAAVASIAPRCAAAGARARPGTPEGHRGPFVHRVLVQRVELALVLFLVDEDVTLLVLREVEDDLAREVGRHVVEE